MYTNICTRHGLHIMREFMKLFATQLPEDFPVESVLLALNLVMKNNIFELGASHFKQLDGAAMGAPVACQCATICCAFHETTRLLRKHSRHLLHCK